MSETFYEDVWEELKNENSESRMVFETADDISRIIVELIEARVDRGYTQRQLADKCGIKQSAIARMESLKTIPRLDTVIRVANALKVVISVERVTAYISKLDDYNYIEENDSNYYSVNSCSYSINSGETNEYVG